MEHLAYRIAVFFLVFELLVNSAIAGTGTCTTSSSACVRTCGRAAVAGSVGVPCNIRVSESGSTATVAAQSVVKKDTVCVAPNTQISWFTSETSSKFTVTFGSQNPFGTGSSRTFAGDETQAPQGDTVGASYGCYRYSVTHGISGSNASADPKVIVTGTVLEGKKHRKPKPSSPK